jgi:hypothetical protein
MNLESPFSMILELSPSFRATAMIFFTQFKMGVWYITVNSGYGGTFVARSEVRVAGNVREASMIDCTNY